MKRVTMTFVIRLGLLGLASTLACLVLSPIRGSAQTTSPTESFPSWAYAWDPEFKVPPADDVPQRLPNSTAAFSVKQSRDLFFSPDWHPDDHPPMPDVVARGTKPDVRACGSCHRSAGTGGPENAILAGLPATYIAQQIADMKSGARKFSAPERASVQIMAAIAKAMTEADVQAAAAYFSALKPKRTIKVVEADSVPKTYIARLVFAKRAEGGTEPLGRRLIEVPDNLEQFELRDSRSQFTAYVPVGSIAKGEALAKTGGSGLTLACVTCHGPDLKGVGPIPRIAGLSPSYIVRQLYDFKQGVRAGNTAALMKPVVAKLSVDDMISLAAYAASREP
jgi:cytochrome c553